MSRDHQAKVALEAYQLEEIDGCAIHEVQSRIAKLGEDVPEGVPVHDARGA